MPTYHSIGLKLHTDDAKILFKSILGHWGQVKVRVIVRVRVIDRVRAIVRVRVTFEVFQ